MTPTILSYPLVRIDNKLHLVMLQYSSLKRTGTTIVYFTYWSMPRVPEIPGEAKAITAARQLYYDTGGAMSFDSAQLMARHQGAEEITASDSFARFNYTKTAFYLPSISPFSPDTLKEIGNRIRSIL